MKTSKEMIHIDETYALQGDSVCVTLYKKRLVKQKGELQLDVAGYFPSLSHALNRMIEMELGERRSLQAILDGIDDLKKWLENSLYNLSGGQNKLKGYRVFTPQIECFECKHFKKFGF